MTEFTPAQISKKIYFIRGFRVMLDADLASLYGVKTGALNRAVRRNQIRFPADFMFQLTESEAEFLRCQIGISKWKDDKRGGRRYVPLVFTEQGVSMLSRVLKGDKAALVKKYDSQFKAVFDAIRQLMNPPEIPRRRIGIVNEE